MRAANSLLPRKAEGAECAAGATLVVDGGEWMYRKPILPREAVSKASRGVEASSRSIVRNQSKL